MKIFLKIIIDILPMINRVSRENKKFMIEVSKTTSSIIIKE